MIYIQCGIDRKVNLSFSLSFSLFHLCLHRYLYSLFQLPSEITCDCLMFFYCRFIFKLMLLSSLVYLNVWHWCLFHIKSVYNPLHTIPPEAYIHMYANTKWSLKLACTFCSISIQIDWIARWSFHSFVAIFFCYFYPFCSLFNVTVCVSFGNIEIFCKYLRTNISFFCMSVCVYKYNIWNVEQISLQLDFFHSLFRYTKWYTFILIKPFNDSRSSVISVFIINQFSYHSYDEI